jgi:type I restriction enzyme S subunit
MEPDAEHATCFGTEIKSAHELIIEENTLAGLRDTLLPKLISGELRIKDAERFVGEVTA